MFKQIKHFLQNDPIAVVAIIGISVVAGIATIVQLLISPEFGLIQGGNDEDFPPTITLTATLQPTPTLAATSTPSPSPTPLAFSPRLHNETLIVIPRFYYSEGVMDVEADQEIRRELQNRIKALDLRRVRAETEPTVIREADREGAEALANLYGATQIIWGEDTGARITVNFLNTVNSDYDAADITISETERTQLADPESYNSFIVEDLPNELAFLSLFALAQSYDSGDTESDFSMAAQLLHQALDSLPDRTSQSLADQQFAAYFHLGWLYQRAGDLIGAKLSYERAIDLDPSYHRVRNNLGVIYSQMGLVEQAIAEFDKAIEINPGNSAAFNNRAIEKRKKGDHVGAISDYTRSIELSEKPRVYLNRGLAYQYRGQYDLALADYNRAIEIDPDYALAYFRRGTAVYRHTGDCTSALSDYNKYLELAPDSFSASEVEKEIRVLTERRNQGGCR